MGYHGNSFGGYVFAIKECQLYSFRLGGFGEPRGLKTKAPEP